MAPPPAEPHAAPVARWLVAAGVGAIVIVAVALGRWYAARRVVEELIVPAPAGAGTPRSAGVPFADLQLTSGDHTIHAWWVRAPRGDSAAPAVLVFHANRSSLSEQVGVQQVLYRAGISSLAFDYSGFGASGGQATPRALRVDARAALAAFADSTRDAPRRVLMGTSLGAAVLLDAITDLQTGVDGVILIGTFATTREAAARARRVPGMLLWLIPQVYDNLGAIRTLRRPLLVLHSAEDEVFPMDDALRLMAAAPEPKRLVRLDHGAHGAYLSAGADWAPVIEFIKKGLP